MEPDVIAWPGSRRAGSPHAPATRTPRALSSDEVLAGLFSQHYVALVRLAVAEEVVQDAFVAMDRRRLKDPDKALAYLLRAVVSGSRSVLPHRTVEDRNPPQPFPDLPSAGHGAMVNPEMSGVATALGTLPRRQREAVILRYYADLSGTETAAAMGISEGAAKNHAHRGAAALRQRLNGSRPIQGAPPGFPAG